MSMHLTLALELTSPSVLTDGKLRPCTFFSQYLSPAERNYNVEGCDCEPLNWLLKNGGTGLKVLNKPSLYGQSIWTQTTVFTKCQRHSSS